MPKTRVASQAEGIYLFTTPARMMRPLYNLTHKTVEYIGTLEQVYMNICVNASDAHQVSRKKAGGILIERDCSPDRQ